MSKIFNPIEQLMYEIVAYKRIWAICIFASGLTALGFAMYVALMLPLMLVHIVSLRDALAGATGAAIGVAIVTIFRLLMSSKG